MTKLRVLHLNYTPGWPDEFEKCRPKCCPNPFFVKINWSLLQKKRVTEKCWALSVIFKQLSTENNRPKGENWPNLITLLYTTQPGEQSDERGGHTKRIETVAQSRSSKVKEPCTRRLNPLKSKNYTEGECTNKNGRFSLYSKASSK
jgi:hypothetical protein